MRSVTHGAKLRLFTRIRTCAVRIQAIVLAAMVVSASAGAAQTPADESDRAMLHAGPLALTPAFTLADFGHESNVFNEAKAPRSDTTATFSPSAKVWMRAGPVVFSNATRVDAVVFQRYATENTVSAVNSARVDVSLNRVQPYAAHSFMRFNDRPDLEIDSRVLHYQQTITAGVLVRVAARTFVRLFDERSSLTFAQGGTFRARDLQALNRTGDLRAAAFEYDLTPVSQFQFSVQREETRFKATPDRNAHGTRTIAGLSFKPRALLSGYARAGLLQYHPDDPAVPAFRGLIASANLRSVIGGTQLAGDVDRDLFYSIDAQVYYLQTSVGVALARQLTARWFLTGTASRQWLTYSAGGPAAAGSAVAGADPFVTAGALVGPLFVSPRPDTVSTVGASVGCRLTRGAVASFGVSYAYRDAALESGRYANFKAVGGVTYGVR